MLRLSYFSLFLNYFFGMATPVHFIRLETEYVIDLGNLKSNNIIIYNCPRLLDFLTN